MEPHGRPLLLLVLSHEKIAESDPEGAAMADLITSDRRVGPAIGFTWLPTVSHQAVCDVSAR
jgi:hypothetical protein